MSTEPPIQDGEFQIDRHGTIEHIGAGPLSRVMNGVPFGSIRFVAEAVSAKTVYFEYTEEEFRQAWGTELFEDPMAAEEKRKEQAIDEMEAQDVPNDIDDEAAAELVEGVVHGAEPALSEFELASLEKVAYHLRQ